MNKAAFTAALIELKVKRLVSGDKSMRLTLEVDYPSDELVNALNRLFKADAQVAVAIAEDTDG